MKTKQKNGNRPAYAKRIGNVRVTVWENENEGQTYFNSSLVRRYKDGDEWKESSNLNGLSDITAAVFALNCAATCLWALLNPQRREELEKLIESAIKQGFQWLIDEIPLARKGKGGYSREFADIAVAIFRHATARNHNDPQLHYHCVIANVVRNSDGKFSKLDSRALHQWTRTLGPLIRNNVAKLLQEQMGLNLYQPIKENGIKAGWFEIENVPQKLCDHWSSRSKEIAAMTQLADGGKANCLGHI